MPSEKTQRRKSFAASICALAAMAIGGMVLHQTLQGTDDQTGLSLWSVVLALTWTVGWVMLYLLAGPSRERRETWHLPAARRHPMGFSLVVGLAFALASLCGALVLRELPFLSAEVTGTAGRVTDGPLAVFAVALITGAAEEAFFRLGLAQLLPSRWFPLVSTLAYGCVTLASGNFALTLAALLLGATSSIALVLTHRWYTPFIVHAMWTIALVGIFPQL